MALSDYIPGALAGAGGFLSGYVGGQQQKFENKLNQQKVDTLDRYRKYLEDVGRSNASRTNAMADLKLNEYRHKQALWDAGNKLLRASNALEQLRLGIGPETAVEHLKDVVGDPGLTFQNGSLVTSSGKAYSLDDARKMLEREIGTYKTIVGGGGTKESNTADLRKARLTALVNAYKAAVSNGDDTGAAYFSSLLQQEFGGVPQQVNNQQQDKNTKEEEPGLISRALSWIGKEGLPALSRHAMKFVPPSTNFASTPFGGDLPRQLPADNQGSKETTGGQGALNHLLGLLRLGSDRILNRQVPAPPDLSRQVQTANEAFPVDAYGTMLPQSKKEQQGRTKSTSVFGSIGDDIAGFIRSLRTNGAPDIHEAVKNMPSSIKSDPVMRDIFLSNYKRILKDMVDKLGDIARQNAQIAQSLKAKAFDQALIETMRRKINKGKK